MEESARPGSAAAASPGRRAPPAPNPAFAPTNAWPPVGEEPAPRHSRRGTEREELGRRSGTGCTHRETGQTPPDTPAPSVPHRPPPGRVPELSTRRDGPERCDTKRRAKRRPRPDDAAEPSWPEWNYYYYYYFKYSRWTHFFFCVGRKKNTILLV